MTQMRFKKKRDNVLNGSIMLSRVACNTGEAMASCMHRWSKRNDNADALIINKLD